MSTKVKSFSITVDAKTDVLDIRQGKLSQKLKGYPVVPGAQYIVSVVSSATYGNNLPVEKIAIYNTTNKRKDGWFYVVEQGRPKVIQIGSSGIEHDKVYAFFIDITSEDNSGSATVTFSPIQ